MTPHPRVFVAILRMTGRKTREESSSQIHKLSSVINLDNTHQIKDVYYVTNKKV